MTVEIVQGDGLSALGGEPLKSLERRYGQLLAPIVLMLQLPLLIERQQVGWGRVDDVSLHMPQRPDRARLAHVQPAFVGRNDAQPGTKVDRHSEGCRC